MAKLRVDKIAAPIIEEEYTGSVHLPGTGNRVVASGFDSNLTGAFTIEGWYLASTLNTDSIFFGNYDSTSDAEEGLYLRYSNTDDEMYLFWRDADASSHIILRPGSVIFNTNQWHHIAVTRDSSDTVRIFLDGRSLGSVNNTDSAETVSMTNNNFAIGALSPDHSDFWNGYVSNFRIVNGTALYTDDFEVPTSELKPVDGTVLLCCQSSTSVTEEASGGSTLTTTGSPVAVSDPNPGFFRKFNVSSKTSETTGSVFFDGTGDCLTAPDGSDFEFGSDNFTIEAYIYYTGSPGTGSDTYVITSKWDNQAAPNDKGFILRISDDGSGDNLQWFYTTDGSTNDSTTGSTILVPESWYHVAFVRNGTTGTFYIDGTADATTVSFGSDSIRDTGNPFRIGANLESGAIDQEFQGYISNLRVCKGHAVYTENFTVPTRELEVHPGPDDDRTVLLCCYDGENIFAEKTGKTIAAIGDRTSSPTPTATDSPIGITTFQPGLTRDVDPTAGPVFQGGAGFTSQNWLTLPKGTTEQRQSTGTYNAGTRGVAMGGDASSPNPDTIIDYITIASLGNATDFGDLAISDSLNGDAVADHTRGVCLGGRSNVPTPNSRTNTIQFVTISSTGNSQDFGDLVGMKYGMAGFSDSTRGISAGGGVDPNSTANIDYITIASAGNAQDFGDCVDALTYSAGFSSPTRGIKAGGAEVPGSAPELNLIEYVTIQTTGNAQDFGDLITPAWRLGGCSNAVRGVILEGESPAGDGLNAISYVTISTLGNAQDFGDATTAGQHSNGTSSSTRGVFMGRQGASPYPNLTFIDFVHIMTTSNAQDFGDLTVGRQGVNACSNGHGGLG